MTQEQRPRAAKGEGSTHRIGGGFTAVPHELLRKEGWFREPLDFMVYMTLFSYSHGFGRPTADMSQSQLERFTGAAKNTIKRSLERLTKDGWIKLVEEYEHARVSRKWRVLRPEDRRGPRPGRRAEDGESGENTVRPAQSPELIPSLSKADTLTVSTADTYIDNPPKERSKNSLTPFDPRRSNEERVQKSPTSGESALPEELKAHLDSLRPARKRHSELSALTELAVEFNPEDLAAALAWVRRHGLPGSGDPVHSPLAFLAAGGITRVMSAVREEQSKRTRAVAQEQAEVAEQQRRDAEERAAEREAATREAVFLSTYSSREEQQRVIESYRSRFPGLSPTGQILRGLAIQAWWKEQRAQMAG